MITPLMHILSCLDDKYKAEHPVSIQYLSHADRSVIVNEALRICKLVQDPDAITMYDSKTVYTTQYYGDQDFEINPYTAVLLERIQQCASVYVTAIESTGLNEEEEGDTDLSSQAVILRLEGNPGYIYSYVYKVMESKSRSYAHKITVLSDLLNTIASTITSENTGSELPHSTLMKLQLQGSFNYWKAMLTADIVRHTAKLPEEEFTPKTIEVIRSDLRNLGIYGFVNPYKMYTDFNNSRVHRKTSNNINVNVINYLVRVIASGGGYSA